MMPYLSICMGLGGNLSDDLLGRLYASVTTLNMLNTIYRMDLELVAVEWNISLRDTGKVESALRSAKPNFPARIIHTPRQLHEQVPNPHGFRYFEWYPKNIGIRRAQGEFVLSTNPDDLWSANLAKFISGKELKRGHFYRVNRHDTRDGEVFMICYPTGGHSPNDSDEQIKLPSSPRACAWTPEILHFCAAGDFTLMAKDDWFLIHGNPEREYNDTVDGQTVWLAHQKALQQIILPYPIYHPEHQRTLNRDANDQLAGPYWDDNNPFTQENGEDWGFVGMEFEETTL